jgi:hypothetical protein
MPAARAGVQEWRVGVAASALLCVGEGVRRTVAALAAARARRGARAASPEPLSPLSRAQSPLQSPLRSPRTDEGSLQRREALLAREQALLQQELQLQDRREAMLARQTPPPLAKAASLDVWLSPPPGPTPASAPLPAPTVRLQACVHPCASWHSI